MSESLRRLWKHGQADDASDAPLRALFAESDQDADEALDRVAESPRMAAIVQVVAGLRGDAEALSREIKQQRQPRAPQRSSLAQRWPWAVAASVVMMAWWAMPPEQGVLRAPAAPQVASQSSAQPGTTVAATVDGAESILTASFEAAPTRRDPALFSAGFDS